MPFLIVLALALWALIGSPSRDIANLFWSSSAAPWERIDGYYYPSRTNLSRHEVVRGFASVEDCRAWARMMARRNDDSSFSRSDYECGIGEISEMGGMQIYRITVR